MEEYTIEHLFKQHYLDMYRLAKSYLYDAEASKDVVSDIFANLAHSQKVLPKDAARQYLMTSIRNRCINIIKQKKLRERIIQLYLLEDDRESVLHPISWDELEDRKRRVHDFVSHQLTHQDKDLFRMRFIDEMPYQEIMQATHLSRMTIYKHLSNAINLIKEHFNTPSK